LCGGQVKVKRIHIRHGLKFFRCLAILAAACVGGIPAAHAACVSSDGQVPHVLALPATTISASKDIPVGATLGSVRVAAVQDIPFACTGTSNAREVRLAGTVVPVPVADFSNVYGTSLAGVGMRVTVSGGSFAGIDDGPRLAPYKVELPLHANHLTGFGVQIDFVKTGTVQNGVLEAGKLLIVLVGGTQLIEVEIPRDAIVLASSQCDALHVGGAVGTAIGTAGAFSYESLAVSTGCNPGVGVMLQLDQGYVYGSKPLLIREDSPAHPAAARGSLHVEHPLSGLLDNAPSSFTAGGGTTFGTDNFGAGAPGGAGHAPDIRH
jgi:hypothetical protein